MSIGIKSSIVKQFLNDLCHGNVQSVIDIHYKYPNITNKLSKSPLYYCFKNFNEDLIKYFVSKNLTVDIRTHVELVKLDSYKRIISYIVNNDIKYEGSILHFLFQMSKHSVIIELYSELNDYPYDFLNIDIIHSNFTSYIGRKGNNKNPKDLDFEKFIKRERSLRSLLNDNY